MFTYVPDSKIIVLSFKLFFSLTNTDRCDLPSHSPYNDRRAQFALVVKWTKNKRIPLSLG